MWAAAATKYLKECAQRKVRTLEMIRRHVTDLLPYIGSLPMQDVCNDALEAFKLDRLDDGVKHATINRSLEVVRTTLIRSRAGVARRRTALVDDGASDRDAGRSCAKARTLSDHLG